MLTREQILNVQDLEIKEIAVPEWGGSVYIKQLTRGQQDEYQKRQYGSARMKMQKRTGENEVYSVSVYGHDTYLVVCAVCDEDGNQLFTDADVKKLKEKNGAVIGNLAVEIVKFSEMEEDVAEIGEMEQQEQELDELKN